MKKGRPKEWYVGKELGKSIFLAERLLKSGGNQKFKLACKKCNATKDVWTSQIYTGGWKVCEHDLD